MLRFRSQLCTGCHLCEIACSAAHVGEFAPSRARIRALVRPQSGEARVMACFSCPQAPCLAACPRAAITRPGPRQPLQIDATRCDGCGGAPACVAACPHGAMYYDVATSQALACDLCGGDPECVKFCYAQAVSLAAAGKEAG